MFPATHLADGWQYIEVAGDNGRDRVPRQAKEQLLAITESQRCKRGWLSESTNIQHIYIQIYVLLPE